MNQVMLILYISHIYITWVYMCMHNHRYNIVLISDAFLLQRPNSQTVGDFSDGIKLLLRWRD